VTRKRLKIAAIGAFLVVGSLVTIEAMHRLDFHDHRPDVVGLFGGEGGYAIVARSAKVEAFRVAPKDTREGDAWMAADYVDQSGPVTLSPDLASSVSAALTAPSSYYWHETATKACPTLYNVRLAFYRGSNRVDVYLCFGCNDLAVVEGGKERGKDFTEIRPTLLKAVRQLFPFDPGIQGLRDR
jgi:hypothetical protein